MKIFDSALSALALGQKNLSTLWVVPSVLIQPAHLVERIGLAIIGGACGLFVAVASSGSSWIALLIVFYGAFAFYVGIDLPSRPDRRIAAISKQWNAGHAVEMFSAVGTFLAAIPTFLSVSLIVLDENLAKRIDDSGHRLLGDGFFTSNCCGHHRPQLRTAEIVVSDF